MTRLAGSHVLVTGGSEGIGLASARAAHRRGARVSIISRSEDKLASARSSDPYLATAPADVTDPDALRRALGELTDAHGPCDVMIAAAGGARPGRLETLDADTFRTQMELNYLGTVHGVQAVLPEMLARGRGHLVLISSLAGLLGVFGYGAYAPSKFAVRGLGLTLDAELGHRGITVSVAYPPDTDTPGFAEENRTKPPETQRLSEGTAPLPAEQVARAIIRGIERDRLTISADRTTACIARLSDLHGPVVRALMRARTRPPG